MKGLKALKHEARALPVAVPVLDKFMIDLWSGGIPELVESEP